MLGQVHRPDDRPARPDLDDGDPAELDRPHPEALERQVEQGEQGDLEHAVVADDDRPRLGRRRVAVAADLGADQRARTAGGGQRRRGASSQPVGDPRPDVGEALAAGRPGLGRRCRQAASRSPSLCGDLASRAGPPSRPGRSRANRSSGRIGIAGGGSSPPDAPGRSRRPSPRRATAASGRSRAAAPTRERQRRRRRAGAASRARDERRLAPAPARRAACRPALEPALDDQLRLAVADEDERRVEAGRGSRGGPGARRRVVGRRPPLSGRRPSRIVQSSTTDSWSADRLLDLGRHVVVEGEDHQRVGARRGPRRGASR